MSDATDHDPGDDTGWEADAMHADDTDPDTHRWLETGMAWVLASL